METSHQFPESRRARMDHAARSFDWRNPRLDALSPRARQLLWDFKPQLAMQLETGRVDAVSVMDAGESLWFARQLEYIRPGLFEIQYPELKGKQIVPVNSVVAPGAEQYTYRAFDHVGEAIVMSDYTKVSPRSDVSGKESTQVIRGLTTSYGYNLQEMRAAMLAQLPLDVRKAMAARDLMERKLDDVIFFGDGSSGLSGFCNLSSGTTSYTVANGNVSGNQLWLTKSPDEIAQDMHGIINNVVTQTLEVEQPDTLCMGLVPYGYISTRRMSDGSNQTILDFFLRTSPHCKQVIPTFKLDYANRAAWSGSSGRMVALRQDPMKLEAIIPQEFEQLPPQMEGFETKTICHARTGGVVAYFPASISYGDGISGSGG